MSCSPPGSPVHGMSPMRVLEWLPFPFLGDLPDPRIESTPPVGGLVTAEPPRKPHELQLV